MEERGRAGWEGECIYVCRKSVDSVRISTVTLPQVLSNETGRGKASNPIRWNQSAPAACSQDCHSPEAPRHSHPQPIDLPPKDRTYLELALYGVHYYGRCSKVWAEVLRIHHPQPAIHLSLT
jgi:hypothetical protein